MTIENKCREWLTKAPFCILHDAKHTDETLAEYLATFVQEQVDEAIREAVGKIVVIKMDTLPKDHPNGEYGTGHWRWGYNEAVDKLESIKAKVLEALE